MIDVVAKAQDMGIYTIVCDYSLSSPSKAIADKSYNISTTDIDGLVGIGSQEKIDGVFTAFEDLNTWNALKISEKLGLPFYATRRQLELISNKLLLKKVCLKYGVPVVHGYPIKSINEIPSLKRAQYPLIIKPSDNYGSKGITICYSYSEVINAYEKAMLFSRSECILAEPFYNGYGVEMYYTIIDGTPFLSAMADRHVFSEQQGNPPLPTATIFPSKHLDRFCENMNEKLKNLIINLKIKNGVVLFQAVIDKNDIYIYEMAYRLTGEQHYNIIKRETGLDLLKMMIELSLYGKTEEKIEIKESEKNILPYPACNLAILLKKGKINSIKGLDIIVEIPEMISFVQTLYEGDVISQTGNYGQMCFRFNYVAKDMDRLFEITDTINKNLKILSDLGRDMILTQFVKENFLK